MNLFNIIRGVKRNRTLRLEKETRWVDDIHYTSLNTSVILDKALELANKYEVELISVKDACIYMPTDLAIDVTIFGNRENYIKFANELISHFSTYIKNFCM